MVKTPLEDKQVERVSGRLMAAVTLCGLAAVFWAFWGGGEVFHEGFIGWGFLLFFLACIAFIALSLVVIPLLVAISVALSGYFDWRLRADDGFRGERTIQGNEVTLAWAAQGPGWPELGTKSWNEIALYGAEPVGFEGERHGLDGHCDSGVLGLAEGWESHCATKQQFDTHNACLYLNESGTELLRTKQNTWRMPTTDEVLRSLTRTGINAGCYWDESKSRPSCREKSLHETPLWDTDGDVIYLWTEEVSPGEARYVIYRGRIFSVPKYDRAGSLGFRCVRNAR